MTLAFKFLYRIYRTLSGVRYWGYRRFTRAGLTVLGGLFLAGILGPDTDNNVAYQGFTFLLLLLLLASWPFVQASFSGHVSRRAGDCHGSAQLAHP